MTNWQDLVYRFRWQIALLLVGIILAAGGIFLGLGKNEPEFEIVESGRQAVSSTANLIVEVSGAVGNPGVYELSGEARIEDAIKAAGGISSDAATNWIERYLNRAAFVTDGQKIYIPARHASQGDAGGPWQSEEVSDNTSDGYQSGLEGASAGLGGVVNINTASQSELESLHGIGPVYAQKIIDNRPYSDVNELLVKKVVTQKIYEDNKDLLTVY
jgi:competence protein ComEA